jgi:mevalonate kinase
MSQLKSNKASASYAPGKLLLTGEYLVLKGAKALAIPLKLGQHLTMKNFGFGLVNWETRYNGTKVFEAGFCPETLTITETNNIRNAQYISLVLSGVKTLNPNFFPSKGLSFLSELEFPLEWGLGNSSALIVNLARLAGVDPLKLHELTSIGSGYDVACAFEEKPILYTLIVDPEWQTVPFSPNFKDELYFIYLGNKQNSEKSVRDFWLQCKVTKHQLLLADAWTMQAMQSQTSKEFVDALQNLTHLTSEILGVDNPLNALFSDLDVFAKPLGAWGGDFALVVTKLPKHVLKNYLYAENIDVLFSWDELVKAS